MRWLPRRFPQAPPKGRHAVGRAAPLVAEIQPAPPPTLLVTAERPPRETVLSSGVFLGFSDGSDHELAVGDPRVSAFRAVAHTLVGV